jgi:hypothetical protein
MSNGKLLTTWTNVQRSKTFPQKRKRKKRPFPVGLRLRLLRRAPLIRELRLYAEQQHGLHPDRYLIAFAWHLADDCLNPVASLIDYAAVIGRRLDADEAMAILAEADSLEPQRGSYTLAKWLGIPNAIRRKYRLPTILGCDTTPEEAATQRKLANKARMAKQRRASGALPRAQYLAAMAERRAERDREVAASGRSQATWYRRQMA